MMFRVLGVPSVDPRFAPNPILRLLIHWMASVELSDSFVACSTEKFMQRTFLAAQKVT